MHWFGCAENGGTENGGPENAGPIILEFQKVENASPESQLRLNDILCAKRVREGEQEVSPKNTILEL